MNEGRGSVVQDVSPFGNHGTMISNPQWWASEKGTSVYMEGSSYINVPNSVCLQTRSAFSIVAMYRLYNFDGGPYPTVWSAEDDDAYGRHSAMRIDAVNRKVIYSVGNGSENKTVFGSTTVAANVFYDQALSYDGAQMRCYLSGVADGDGMLSGPLATVAVSPRLGLRSCPPSQLPIYADCVRLAIYSRALSADEIAALYAAPYLPLWRPRMGISLAMLTPAAGLPLITSRTLGRIGPSLRGLR